MSDDLKHEVEHVQLILKNDDGEILGGLLAVWYWDWDCMEVDIVWVDERLRGQGFRSKLLTNLEQIAIEKQCGYIELNTFSF